MDRLKARNGYHALALSPETLDLLIGYQWPGNVRELEAVVRRYALSGREETIYSALGSQSVFLSSHSAPVQANGSTLQELEAQTLLRALTEARWNQRRAAVTLGISYSALRRRIAKHGLKDVK